MRFPCGWEGHDGEAENFQCCWIDYGLRSRWGWSLPSLVAKPLTLTRFPPVGRGHPRRAGGIINTLHTIQTRKVAQVFGMLRCCAALDFLWTCPPPFWRQWRRFFSSIRLPFPALTKWPIRRTITNKPPDSQRWRGPNWAPSKGR